MQITARPPHDSAIGPYLKHLPEGDLIEIFEQQMTKLMALIGRLSDREAEFRYEVGKWSIKEVLGHLSDCERVFSYRLLVTARSDSTPMASFEQDDYVLSGGFDSRTIRDLLEEWVSVRKSTLSLLRSLTATSLNNGGTLWNVPTTALTVACITAGHTNHHIEILEDRYGL